MRALIVIDYTIDFVADEGKLTCGKPGQAIEDRIATLMEEFSTEDYVVIANDIHEEGDT
ncbi:MAG TPA: isochorismatase, partial [Exiguobacterium sp.]|nr:isochorismatase [Exiguobacterium sp.]